MAEFAKTIKKGLRGNKNILVSHLATSRQEERPEVFIKSRGVCLCLSSRPQRAQITHICNTKHRKHRYRFEWGQEENHRPTTHSTLPHMWPHWQIGVFFQTSITNTRLCTVAWKETGRHLNREMKCFSETICNVKKGVMEQPTHPVRMGFCFLLCDVDCF